MPQSTRQQVPLDDDHLPPSPREPEQQPEPTAQNNLDNAQLTALLTALNDLQREVREVREVQTDLRRDFTVAQRVPTPPAPREATASSSAPPPERAGTDPYVTRQASSNSVEADKNFKDFRRNLEHHSFSNLEKEDVMEWLLSIEERQALYRASDDHVRDYLTVLLKDQALTFYREWKKDRVPLPGWPETRRWMVTKFNTAARVTGKVTEYYTF